MCRAAFAMIPKGFNLLSFPLYLIAAGFPDMGYLYPGFLYLNKTYLTRPHTVGPCP